MAGIGAATLFVGIFLMYDAYRAIHTHAQAAPITSVKAALKLQPSTGNASLGILSPVTIPGL